MVAVLCEKEDPPYAACEATLNRVITFHQNKEEEHHLKTLGKDKADEGEDGNKSRTPPPLKRNAKSTLTPPVKKLKVDATVEKASASKPPHSKKVVSKRRPNSPHQSPKDNDPLRPNLNVPIIDLSDGDMMRKELITVNQLLALEMQVKMGERRDRKFQASMEYTHAIFVQRVPQPVIPQELETPFPPIHQAPGTPKPRQED
ncbi:hypothetical protein E5676_scaffold552G001110 [Cucumis melo var. makuwa]|uniref:Uncharacterized protein n=1 Tax=Cucumis melo var. makuwa TaxID=1194695 RepID=A0A5D3CT45_CUCMM|nr:hypothetical protein E5676_scaffold552G001110 [Cucumis melo var. makuwa]